MLNPEKLSKNSILIIGETRSGKTRLLHRFIYILAEAGHSREITVIDMAPSASWGVGGKIIEVGEIPEEIRYYTSWKIKPPRLLGKSREEVLELARTNAELIRPLIDEYVKSPTGVLIVNDATIFVHSGEPSTLLNATSLSRSWIITAYHGRLLEMDKSSGLTSREREFVKHLMRRADIIIRTA